jgi:hypothetical protein
MILCVGGPMHGQTSPNYGDRIELGDPIVLRPERLYEYRKCHIRGCGQETFETYVLDKSPPNV